MRKRTVFWILLLLAAFFLIDRTVKRAKSNDFDTVLIDLDTAKVEVIRLNFPSEDYPVVLVREPQAWVASCGNTSILANATAIRELMHEISNVEVSEIVTDQPESWPSFGVGENQGVRVEILANGEKLEDFITGIGSAGTDAGEHHRFVRLTDQSEVYRVENNDMIFSTRGFERYRNRHFFNLPETSEIQTILYKSRSKQFQFKRSDNQWILEDHGALDPVLIQNYLRGVANISVDSFSDTFDETRTEEMFDRAITFGLAGGKALTVNCYRDSSWQNRYVLHSELNAESWFESDSSGVFEIFFKRFEQIFPSDITL
jgi:hypothetical protein